MASATGLLHDHLGSTAVTANASGAKTGELRYYPYGSTRTTWGTTPTTYRFTGQREERTIGLYFYNARWYDPVLGRFLQPDPLVPEPGNPQALNRYAYVLNNPIRYTDPTGHRECERYCPDESIGPGIHSAYAGPWDPTAQAQLTQTIEGVLGAVFDVMPGVGDVKGLLEVATGRDLVTGAPLGNWRWLGLLGISEVRQARHADEVAGVVRRLDKDLYAFGSRAGPRPPRVGIDIFPDADGMLTPQSAPFPEGASTFADPSIAPLKGHYHRLPVGTELPHGLDVIADGLDVNAASAHPSTHHTIFNTIEMTWQQFIELFVNLPWQYGGRK